MKKLLLAFTIIFSAFTIIKAADLSVSEFPVTTGADRLCGWDESDTAPVCFTLGTGLSTSGTTLNATGTVDGSGTTNQITYWVDSDTLGALTTVTYPSLTELSYVKGLTSAAQTQINTKQATLSGASLTAVTIATDDKVLIQDTSDSNNLKTVTTQAIADLTTTISGNAGTATALAANGANCSAGQFPLGVDASGNVESCTSAAGSGATTALDNLASVAINTDLISDTDVTDDLGSLAIRWDNIFAARLTPGDTATDALKLSAYDSDGAAFVDFITLTSANDPTATMSNVTSSTAFNPTTNDGAALGAANPSWSDLFLASGGVINWASSSATISHSTNSSGQINFNGGAQVNFGQAKVQPTSNDGSGLGQAGLAWADLFLAEGGVINWDSSDATLTQVGDVVTLAGADLKVTTPGTASTSVATIDGTQELDNKTIDSAVGKGTWTASGTWTLPAWTMGGNVQVGENTDIALDAALSADGKYSGITETGTAGATLAFGDIVYLAAADSRWELTDADASATAGPVKVGMVVLAAAADGNATTILLCGKIRADAAFPALTISAPAYIGETAGDIQTSVPSGTDNIVRVVGFGNTADELYFCPSPDYYSLL